MMTKTTIKAIAGAGGLMATWFAVAPGQNPPPQATASAPQAVESRAVVTDDLQAQTDQLRKREVASDLKPAARNPFRFGAPKPDTTDARRGDAALHVESPLPLPPPPPAPTLTLSGIAEKQMEGGVRRMAVISSETKLYVAAEGDVVEGRYTIVAVDREAVLLRDFAGGELRLILRP